MLKCPVTGILTMGSAPGTKASESRLLRGWGRGWRRSMATITNKSIIKEIRRLVLDGVNITDQEGCRILLRRTQVWNSRKMHKLDFTCLFAGRQQQRQIPQPTTTTTVRNAPLVNLGTVQPTQATSRPRSRRPCVGLCQYYRSRGLENPMEAYYDYS